MLSGLGALALGWHALSRTRVIGSESQALAQRAAAVSASGVDPFAVRDVAVLHYDALEEMSGARSFSLALLNSEGDGVVVTSINGRTESRTYAKPVVGGECDTLLSPEEHRVVRSARLGEGVAAAAAGNSPARAESSADVQPVSGPVVRDAPEAPDARNGEQDAREDAEALADTVQTLDAGPDRERGRAPAPTATTATTATTAKARAGADPEHAQAAPTAPAARTASTAQKVSGTAAAPSGAGGHREGTKADPVAAPAVPAARTAPPAPAAAAATGAPADDGGEREPRGLASVLRRTIGRAGTDRRAPVEAVRSGVAAARPVLSANVTVRSGPSTNVTVRPGTSATGAGRTGGSSAGTATAAEPRPADRTDGETDQGGAREADVPASEARR
jgi:hypothetical protein